MRPTRDDYLTPDIDQTMDTLGDHIPAVVAREWFVRERLTDLAQRAYEHGRHEAIAELLTTSQMAAILGVDDSHVRLLANRHDIGWKVGRNRLYRPEDVDALRSIRAANQPGRYDRTTRRAEAG